MKNINPLPITRRSLLFFGLNLGLGFLMVISPLGGLTAKGKKETNEKWMCTNEDCESYIYDPAEGDPEGEIPPGVKFEDLPEDWTCPVCGKGKWTFIRA